MSLLYKPLERITHEDIQSLIDNQIRESQFIEYKTEVFDKRDEKKRIQFLGSISGFANSLGGDLLVGVKATGGIPVAIPGLDPQSVDQEMLRIREVVANWVEPYLPIHTHPITLPDGKCLIVVRILRSWNPPHGIPNNEQYHFYRRNSAGRAPMTLSELRDSFTLSAGVADRVRAFREKRSVLLQSGSLGVYGIKPTILFHVIPFAGMTGANFIDLTAVPPQSLSPVRMQGGYIETGETRFNLDGLLMHDKGSERPTHWHTQLFRNGAFEYADTDFVERHEASSGWYVNAFQLQVRLVLILGRMLTLYRQHISIPPPYALALTLLGDTQNYLGVDMGWHSNNLSKFRFDQAVVHLPEIVINAADQEPGVMLKELFDYLWNAVGFPGCKFYKEGRWHIDPSWLDAK